MYRWCLSEEYIRTSGQFISTTVRIQCVPIYFCLSTRNRPLGGSIEIVLTLDKGFSASKLGIASGCVRVRCGCDNVIFVRIAGGWDIHLMDTILGISVSSLVMVCNWTLIRRKGPTVQPNHLLYVLFTKYGA